MNKKIVVIVVVLLLLLGGYFVMSKKDTSKMAGDKNTPTENQNSESNAPKTGSLKDLFTAGKSQSCSFETSGESYSSKGTVYVTGGKMRGDFISEVAGATTLSHMIVMDNTSYIWMDGQKQGFKQTFEANTVTPVVSKTPADSSDKGPDVNANYSYDCSSWLPDNSKFELPADVEFASLTEMMNSVKDNSTSTSSGMQDQCSACEQLQGDSKTACLTALKCN